MSNAQTAILAVDLIRVDGGTQPRGSINLEMVAEYTADMRAGAVFPPAVVFLDGVDYWLADGFHRFHAARAVPQDTLLVEVKKGTRRDAVLFSLGANTAHGQRRTNADKRRSVGIALSDPEWSKCSDRWIAEVCGVSHTFVQGLRPQVATVATSERTGRDGKVYPVPDLRQEEQEEEQQGPEVVAVVSEPAPPPKRGHRLSDDERARLLAMPDDPEADVPAPEDSPARLGLFVLGVRNLLQSDLSDAGFRSAVSELLASMDGGAR